MPQVSIAGAPWPCPQISASHRPPPCFWGCCSLHAFCSVMDMLSWIHEPKPESSWGWDARGKHPEPSAPKASPSSVQASLIQLMVLFFLTNPLNWNKFSIGWYQSTCRQFFMVCRRGTSPREALSPCGWPPFSVDLNRGYYLLLIGYTMGAGVPVDKAMGVTSPSFFPSSCFSLLNLFSSLFFLSLVCLILLYPIASNKNIKV